MRTIPKELLDRLPATFVPALNEQLRMWALLFPAEQRTLQEQLDYLAGLPAVDFGQLFRPVKDVEAKMRLPAWGGAVRIGISDTSVLVRSPYYPQWRAEVEKIFAQIDDAIAASTSRSTRKKVVVCVLPPGLPLASGPLWKRSAPAGTTVELATTFGEGAAELLESLARRTARAQEPVERAWVLDAGGRLSRRLAPALEGLTVLSFEALGPVRREFLRRLNAIKKDLRSADQAYDDLRRLDLAPLLDEKLRRDPRLSGFVRDLFLSGNGALLFGNSFAEWGASEALRRAQPQLMICAFGVRRKLKPFSSVAMFEDQERANPVPEQDDAPSSLVDAQILAEYVYLSTLRLRSHAGHTLGVFAVEDRSTVQVLGPSSSPAWTSGPLAPSELSAGLVRWMEEGT